MKPNRIDLHHHVFPPELVAEMSRRGIEWTGGTGIPQWSVERSLEMMDRYGIAATVASPQPEVCRGEGFPAADWARHSNEYLARLVQQDPVHFGGFAVLPLPDVAAACREVEHAFDVLKLDGVLLLTSHEGRYLGNPAFEELFQELNRRSAIVCIHPNTEPPGSKATGSPLPNSLVEFTFDTTRCVASLLYSGTLDRYPSIRYILPHAGGAVPYLAWRMSLGAAMVPKLRERVPQGPLHYLRQLYYDTALSTSDYALAALREFVPAGQIVFGSDFPFVQGPILDVQMHALDTTSKLDDAVRAAVNRDNALRLFPRFGQSSASAAA